VPTTGAGALVRSLEALGVEVAFGIPGGAILPAYDPLYDSKVRHILVRHEQGAGHAATGYAQATGKVGVCIATSGPGATNLVTPIADAYMDSVPIVAITGQVARPAIGTDAFQEADIQGITLPITKHNFLVQTPRSCRGSSPRRSTWRRPAGPARSWSTSRRTCCRRRPRSPGRRPSTCPATGPRCTRTASRSARRPG
jgi:acetolactate synthase-1/2/3 large subunit